MLVDYIVHKPILETERLRLRPLIPKDVPALREWMPNPALYQYWGKRAGKTDRDPSLLFQTPDRPSKSFHLGVAEICSGKAIGEIWVYCIEKDRMAKVAYRIGEPYQAQGYATEALRAMIRFCFEETELDRLWAEVDVRNVASYRVLEKCGFVREGLIRRGKMVSSWCDYYLYAMLREEYSPLPDNE